MSYLRVVLCRYVFSNDEEVVDLVARVLPIICSFLLFDNIQGTSSGVLKGCGRQAMGAGVNLAGYWLLGLPLGIALAFKTDLGIRGQWIGLSISSFLIAIVYTVVLWRMDWVATAHIVHTRETEERLKAAAAGGQSDSARLNGGGINSSDGLALDPLPGLELSGVRRSGAVMNGEHHSIPQSEAAAAANLTSPFAQTPGGGGGGRRPSDAGEFSFRDGDTSTSSTEQRRRSLSTNMTSAAAASNAAPLASPAPVIRAVALPTNIEPLAPPPASATLSPPTVSTTLNSSEPMIASPTTTDPVAVRPHSILQYQHNYPMPDTSPTATATSPHSAAGTSGVAAASDDLASELERELNRADILSPTVRALVANANAIPPLPTASATSAGAPSGGGEEPNFDALEQELQSSGIISPDAARLAVAAAATSAATVTGADQSDSALGLKPL